MTGRCAAADSDKSSTEYNGWEQYVAAKITDSDTSFIPRNNALVLKAVKEKEQADSQALTSRIEAVSMMVSQSSSWLSRHERLQAALTR